MQWWSLANKDLLPGSEKTLYFEGYNVSRHVSVEIDLQNRCHLAPGVCTVRHPWSC